MKFVVALGFAVAATGLLVNLVPSVAHTVAIGGLQVGGTMLAFVALLVLGVHWSHGK